MTSGWHKVIADLVQHPARTLLAISSIAIGVFMVGTLLGMIDLQLSQMDSAHRASQPAHINLILKSDIDTDVAASLKTLAEVADVDVLTQFSLRFRTVPGAAWQTGTAIFRPDYQAQRYDLMTLVSGVWPHAQAVALERLSAKAAGIKLGDQLQLETAQGIETFVVEGIIRHPFVKPPTFGGQLHVFIAPEAAEKFAIKPHSARQLLVQTRPPYSAEKARLLAGTLRTHLSQLGIGVNATLLQNPEQHWGRPIFSGMNLILSIMAWASLGLSAVLILNSIAALITQQTEQIGVMKALGATRAKIARLYLSEVLVLALVGVVIAIPLSCVGAYTSSRWLLDLFNIALPEYAYSTRALYFIVAGGLLAPCLAALYPIWRGTKISVRAALGSYGLGGDFDTHLSGGWLETCVFKRLPTLFAVSLANLLRRKSRLFWTQCVLIIAGVLFMVILSLMASVKLTLDNELARSRYAVRLGFSVAQSQAQLEQLLRLQPETTGVEFWLRLPAEFSYQGELLRPAGSLGAQLLGLPVTTQFYQPLIVAGRWFTAQDTQQQVLVLNADTAERNGIQVGDTLQVNLMHAAQSDWTVIGLYRWFVGTGYVVESVYAPLATLQNLIHQTDQASMAVLSAEITNLAQENSYMQQLKETLREQHLPLDTNTTVAKLEQRQFAQNQFRPIISMLLGLASLITAVATIGLSGTLALSVLQRTREIGILRALGASSPTIFKLFMLEGSLHGLCAWFISVALAYWLAQPLAHALGETMLGMQLDFCFSLPAVWFWLAIVCLIVVMASYAPAKSATRLVVRDCLNY